MRRNVWLQVVAVSGLLAGCGGGGSDSRPEVAPPPPPAPQNPQPEPPASPQTIHDLRGNHAFTGRAAFTNVTINRTTGEAMSGRTSAGDLNIRYDAASKSYTVGGGVNGSTFAPADINKTTNNFVVYLKERPSSNEQLILLRTALDGKPGPQQVAMGLLQKNTLRPNETDMEFDMFVYGFEAPLAAVPRSGTGSFAIDVFGLTTSPGFEPKVFEGSGSFDLDFGVGVFSTRTNLLETGILSGVSDSGTGFELTGSGKLSGADGTFQGHIMYGGAAGRMPGMISGRFYGPDAKELGASFFAFSNHGNTVVGGMTGSRSSDMPSMNLTLTNLVRTELFSADHAHMHAITGQPSSGDSQFLIRPNGSLEFTSAISTLGSVGLTSESLTASADPNFKAYEKTAQGQTIRLEMYKTGPSNTELKLTYASFGQWQSAPQGRALADGDRVFFTYGLRTPEGALTIRTGSARYEGVAHGTAFNTGSLVRYDVSGTSQFDINFSTKTYFGNLALVGKATSSAGKVDFGTYQFGGSIDHLNRMHTGLQQSGSTVGSLQAGFYGPNAEEIAGSFEMTVMDGGTGKAISIIGATAATQR